MAASRKDFVLTLMRRHDHLMQRIRECTSHLSKPSSYDISEVNALEWALIQLVERADDYSDEDPDWALKVQDLVPVCIFRNRKDNSKKKDKIQKGYLPYYCAICQKQKLYPPEKHKELAVSGMCLGCNRVKLEVSLASND